MYYYSLHIPCFHPSVWDIVSLTALMGKVCTVYTEDAQLHIYISICFPLWKESVLNLFQPMDPNFYRVTTYCNTTSLLKSRVPETRVLGDLSKSSCSIPWPMNLDVIDSRVILSASPDGLCLVKACWQPDQQQLPQQDQWLQSAQVPGASFQAAFPEALN